LSANKYIGLTIGPIIKTIEDARSTGELWGSSYIFSYMMKKIIYGLIDKDKSIKDRFIVPCVDEISDKNKKINIFGTGNKVGLFHDRFIFQSTGDDFENLKAVVQSVKERFAKDILDELKKIYKEENLENADEIKKYLEDFFKIYYVEVEVDLDNKDDEERNIILKVSKYLDAIELREKFNSQENKNYLFEILDNKRIKNTFLASDAYGENDKIKKYPSLLNIAAQELLDTEEAKNKNEDEELKEYLAKNFKDDIRKYHEFVALVQVDGDSMSKVITDLKDRNDYKNFSKKLLIHAVEASNIIKDYGGFTIYAGGDDLLFLAPLANSKVAGDYRNIFELFNGLSQKFNESFSEYIDENKKENPSISFGVSIVRYNFPLYYALEEARNLLFSKAKKFESNTKKKNAIAFKVIKNSGESFESILGQSDESYKKFNNIFKSPFNNLNKNDDEKTIKDYLNRIHIKVLNDKVILDKINGDEALLNNYFKNNYNEAIHKTQEIEAFLELIKGFIGSVYSESKDINNKKIVEGENKPEIDINLCMEKIHSCLKLIKFMNEDSELRNFNKDGKINE
jgi:CRISPR-associated protein Cmr2